MNGLPALLVRYPERDGNHAREAVLWVELDADERIARIRTVVAPPKLRHTSFGE